MESRLDILEAHFIAIFQTNPSGTMSCYTGNSERERENVCLAEVHWLQCFPNKHLPFLIHGRYLVFSLVLNITVCIFDKLNSILTAFSASSSFYGRHLQRTWFQFKLCSNKLFSVSNCNPHLFLVNTQNFFQKYKLCRTSLQSPISCDLDYFEQVF